MFPFSSLPQSLQWPFLTISLFSEPPADAAVEDLEDLETKNPTVFKGHRERGGDVVAKMEAALQTRFGTSLLSTTDDDQESDRLATIGVIIFSSFSLAKVVILFPNFTTLLLNTISL